jgi:hypothetical protein
MLFAAEIEENAPVDLGMVIRPAEGTLREVFLEIKADKEL